MACLQNIFLKVGVCELWSLHGTPSVCIYKYIHTYIYAHIKAMIFDSQLVCLVVFPTQTPVLELACSTVGSSITASLEADEEEEGEEPAYANGGEASRRDGA